MMVPVESYNTLTHVFAFGIVFSVSVSELIHEVVAVFVLIVGSRCPSLFIRFIETFVEELGVAALTLKSVLDVKVPKIVIFVTGYGALGTDSTRELVSIIWDAIDLFEE